MAYIGELSAATQRVIAAALAYRDKHGKDMNVDALIRLAQAARASDNAVIISILGMGASPTGYPVKLSDRSATVVVNSPDARVALRMYGKRRVRAHLDGVFRPW